MNLERLAELKYVKKLIEDEIEREMVGIQISELERVTETKLGKFQKTEKNDWVFNNFIVKEMIGNEVFNSIAKVNKTALSAVTSKEQWDELIRHEGITCKKLDPFLKFIHVHYFPAKISVKTDEKFHTLLKI